MPRLRGWRKDGCQGWPIMVSMPQCQPSEHWLRTSIRVASIRDALGVDTRGQGPAQQPPKSQTMPSLTTTQQRTSGNEECNTESTPSIALVCIDVSTNTTAMTASCNEASSLHMMRACACVNRTRLSNSRSVVRAWLRVSVWRCNS